MRELKRSPYAKDTRMTILASRGHTCIHPLVSKMGNKDELCKKLNKEKSIGGASSVDPDKIDDDSKTSSGCTFLLRLKKQPLSYENFGFKQPVWDIEDLVTSLKKKRVRFLRSPNLCEIIIYILLFIFQVLSLLRRPRSHASS